MSELDAIVEQLRLSDRRAHGMHIRIGSLGECDREHGCARVPRDDVSVVRESDDTYGLRVGPGVYVARDMTIDEMKRRNWWCSSWEELR